MAGGRLLDDQDCFKTLLEYANLLGVIVDTDQRILYCNDYLLRLTGWRQEEVAGKCWTDVFVPAYIEDLSGLAKDLFAGLPSAWHHENDILTRAGARRAVRWNNFLLRDAAGVPMGAAAVGEDITEKKTLERALLECSARERSKIERDLHDGLGQELVGVALLARSLANRAEMPEAAKEELVRLSAIASNAIESCRRIARGVSPLSDMQGGLINAIRQLTVTPQNWSGPAMQFEVEQTAPLKLTEEASDHVYRLAEEGVSNAVRHSGAQSIKVMLNIEPRRMSLEILDDGCGISYPSHAEAGFGLKIMRHRAHLLRADLRIERRALRGTRLRLLCAQRA